MIQIALYEPEIPPNTGNIIRLCANTGIKLHLIHPLGFDPSEKQVRRAGLDYHEWTEVKHHEDYPAFLQNVGDCRIIACSTHGNQLYTDVEFAENDILLFGPETRGLPKSLLSSLGGENIIRIPMKKDSRSLNLSNSVAVILYESLRQIGFNVLSLE